MVREPKPPVSTDAERSRIMRAVGRSKTAPEMALQSALTDLNLVSEANRRDLPGSPDIVFPRQMLAVFVHGCFWHRHSGCRLATVPKSNLGYWRQKFAANKERDRRKIRELRKLGWKTMLVWQCRIEKNPAGVARTVRVELEGAQKPDKGKKLATLRLPVRLKAKFGGRRTENRPGSPVRGKR